LRRIRGSSVACAQIGDGRAGSSEFEIGMGTITCCAHATELVGFLLQRRSVMAELIRFADGVMVEVVSNPDPVTPVAGKTADRISQAFQDASDVMGGVMRSVISSTTRVVRDAGAAEAEIEFGVGFSIEGDIYIAKASGQGNITVKVRVDGEPR
jgi:hypothetical protein